MARPFFSVVVPTWNRAELLRRTMGRVLQQDFRDFELLVADNASDDHTAAVVSSFADARVRYVRRPENLGPVKNWQTACQEAAGEWVVFHQDDDFLSTRFLSRCWDAVRIHTGASVYLSALLGSQSEQSLHKPDWFCPPTAADWLDQPRPMPLQSELLYPFSLFLTIGMSPAAAYRRTALQDCWTPWCEDGLLYNERTMLVELSTKGQILFDPWIGGVYISHGSQLSVVNWQHIARDWQVMVDRVGRLAEAGQVAWQPAFLEFLNQASPRLLADWCAQAAGWSAPTGLAAEVRSLLLPWQPAVPAPPPRPPLPIRLLGRVKKACRALVRGY